MTDMTPPPKGAMVVYDYALPPLMPGRYRMQVSGDVTGKGGAHHVMSNERHFVVDGPRFVINPGDVSSVCPPRNAQGAFEGVLPQIVMKRRTLPWERTIGDALPAPQDPKALTNQQPDYPTPWFALLLLQDGEDYQLKTGVALEQVLPHKVFQAIGSPANILVDALDIDADLLSDILPSREELQLLAHVRQVNPDDRELSIDDTDGFFAVQVCNRLPAAGQKAQMVLVSLEGRTDLLQADPPSALRGGALGDLVVDASVLLDPTVFDLAPASGLVATPKASKAAAAAAPANLLTPAPEFAAQRPAVTRLDASAGFEKAQALDDRARAAEAARLTLAIRPRQRLVVLHKWTFECQGEGDFRGLMQRLDVGMIGKVKGAAPQVLDSGHLPVQLGTRAGTQETALYRGPLVPYPLGRDLAGPYHSADQARRVSPETGVEDISYAAAFEVGRLLAAADGRLAQELMRWRRSAYRLSTRLGTLNAVQALVKVEMGTSVVEQLSTPVLPLASIKLIEDLAVHAPARGDVWGLGAIGQVAGLQPDALVAAYGLASTAVAQQVLTGFDQPLGQVVPAPAVITGASTTLKDVLADTAGLSHLQVQRSGLLANTTVRLQTEAALLTSTVGLSKGEL